jgi:hypothetical protein
MLTTNTEINTLPLSIVVRESDGEHLELSRLLAAAVVNPQFENLLINAPQVALQQGYQEESFLLTQEERDLVLSIHAVSLAEFARLLVLALGERQYLRCDYPAQVEPILIC